jgi:excisionase family DNA binding protein
MSDWLPARAAAPFPQSLLLNPADAAKTLSISPRTLWGLPDRGEIPCIRIGRAVRYDPRDLMAWIAKKRDAHS